MKKLNELNGWELMSALSSLAEPIGHLANDDNFWEVFRECTKKGIHVKQRNTLRFLLTTYSELIPILLGEEHKVDTISILAIIEGKTIEEAMAMNGVELFKDAIEAYKTELKPFFTLSVRSDTQE